MFGNKPKQTFFLLDKKASRQSPVWAMVRLLVLGGNGFLGRSVCRAGLERGWSVTSLSRTGAPAPIPEDLLAVDWRRGSALDQEALKTVTIGSDYIVNTIGTLFESGPAQSYEGQNFRTLQTLIDVVKKNSSHPAIAYISANSFGTLASTLLPKYMDTKRRAESLLQESTLNDSQLKGLVFRPGVLYGKGRPATVASAWMFRLMTLFTAGAFPPPLHADSLGRFIVGVLQKQKESFKIYEASEIQ